MRLSEVQIFKGQKRFFFVEMIPKHYFKMIFAQTPKMQKVRLSEVHIFLGQKRLLPFEKISKYYLKIFFAQ